MVKTYIEWYVECNYYVSFGVAMRHGWFKGVCCVEVIVHNGLVPIPRQIGPGLPLPVEWNGMETEMLNQHQIVQFGRIKCYSIVEPLYMDTSEPRTPL